MAAPQAAPEGAPARKALSEQPVAALKQIAAALGVPTAMCTEKHELVDVIQNVLGVQAKEGAAEPTMRGAKVKAAAISKSPAPAARDVWMRAADIDDKRSKARHG